MSSAKVPTGKDFSSSVVCRLDVLPIPAVDTGMTVLAGTEVTDIKTVWEAIEADPFGSGLHEDSLGNSHILIEPGPVVRIESATDTTNKS